MDNFIDVSNHQANIDLSRVPSQAFIVKATEGKGWRDGAMGAFVRQVRALDKPLGFYHFVSQGNTPQQEADNFLSHTQGHRLDADLLVLDWEPSGTSPSPSDTAWAREWLEYVEDRTPNPLWIYMNLSTARNGRWGTLADRFPLWLAHYPGNNTAVGYNPAGTMGDPGAGWRVDAWQFTDGGRLPNFNGNLDLNRLFRPWWGPSKPSPAHPSEPVVTIPTIRENDPPVVLKNSWGETLYDSRGKARLGCICMAMTLPLVEREMIRQGLIKRTIDVYQGGYNPGGVAASAGMHDMGGVIDVEQGQTLAQRKVWAMFGIMMAPRTPEWGWPSGPHGHGGWHGCVHRTASLAAQVKNMMAGLNGLKSNIRVNWEKPTRTWQEAYRAVTRQPATAPQPKETDVPTFHESSVSFHHAGGWAIPAWQFAAAPARDTAQILHAHALVEVPEHVVLHTRWVSLSPDMGWVRYSPTMHETPRAETSIQIKQAAKGADLRLDVWVDKPCTVGLRQSSLGWSA